MSDKITFALDGIDVKITIDKDDIELVLDSRSYHMSKETATIFGLSLLRLSAEDDE